MKDKIALCLMVKNEEDYIAQCIESVLEFVDTIYILDTGSTDRTVDIAKNYTDKIYFKEFNNDFGYMRNYLLNFVKDEEWILFLDADECFPKESVQTLKKLILNYDDEVGGIRFYRYNFYSRGGWYTDHIVKMFRNKSFKYDKTVSEKIERSVVENGYRIVEPDIILNHFGRSKPRHIREKTTRNYIQLMKKEVEKNNEGLMHAYIGINSMALGDFETALIEGKRAIDIDASSIRSYYFYGNILRSVNKNNEAIKIFKAALNLECGKMRASFLNMIGVTYLSLGEYDKSRKYLYLAMDSNKSLVHININIGLTYFYEKNYKKALYFFQNAGERNSGFLIRNKLADFEYDPFTVCSYETIHNYIGLDNYISICKSNI